MLLDVFKINPVLAGGALSNPVNLNTSIGLLGSGGSLDAASLTAAIAQLEAQLQKARQDLLAEQARLSQTASDRSGCKRRIGWNNGCLDTNTDAQNQANATISTLTATIARLQTEIASKKAALVSAIASEEAARLAELERQKAAAETVRLAELERQKAAANAATATGSTTPAGVPTGSATGSVVANVLKPSGSASLLPVYLMGGVLVIFLLYVSLKK